MNPDPKNPPAIYEWDGPTGVHFIQIRHASGTYYHEGTPVAVKHALESAYATERPIRMFLGDPETGRCWHDEHNVYGWVGRSMGPIRIPILKRSSKSSGGPAILDRCIVRLLLAGIEVYRRPGYKLPVIEIHEVGYDGKLPWKATIDGYEHARFETKAKAERWRMFMLGESMKK